MEPNDKIVACAVTVQRLSPNDHIDTWILAGALVGLFLILVLGIVLYHWADVRDSERDKEIVVLRRIAKAAGLNAGTL